MEMNIVHILAPTRLCYSAIPIMISRKRGVIINLSSLSVYAITKGAAVYSGSKAYLKNFTQALNYELKETGIKFQALLPGFTYSEFHEVGEWQGFNRSTFPKFMWMPKEKVVEYSLKKLKSNSVVVIPGFKNRLIKTLSLTPIIGKTLLKIVNSSKQANS
jgi:short-subunit dehydrogenase